MKVSSEILHTMKRRAAVGEAFDRALNVAVEEARGVIFPVNQDGAACIHNFYDALEDLEFALAAEFKATGRLSS